MKYWAVVGCLLFSLKSFAVILGTNDLVKVSSATTPEIAHKLAKTVGHIKTSLVFPNKCSGFLVSKTLFLSTTDCIPAYLTPERIKIYFNNVANKNTDKYKVSEIVMRNGATKIVLLRLKKSPGLKQGFLPIGDYSPVGTRLAYIENDADSNLLQFMDGPCELYAYSEEGNFAHNCDTTSQGGGFN